MYVRAHAQTRAGSGAGRVRPDNRSGSACGPASNDNRATPATLSAGADVTGTTVDATRELNEPPNCPAKGGDSVWYRYTAPRSGAARVLLETRGGLDATVAIYEVERSTITRVGCADSRKGVAFVEGSLDAGTYLIRVTEREGSDPGTFRLRFSGVLTEPSGTGRKLPASGRLRGKLNPLTRPFLRVSRKLSAGRSYRVRVSVGSGGRCNASIRLRYPDDDTRYFDCRDYTVITPDPSYSGTHVLTVEEGTQNPGTSPTTCPSRRWDRMTSPRAGSSVDSAPLVDRCPAAVLTQKTSSASTSPSGPRSR